MSTGDTNDILARLQTLIPQAWFESAPPILQGVLTGSAAIDANIYALVAYAKLQTRIRTATGGWLDLIALDFYGNALPRQTGESDTNYRTRILAGLFSKANTRAVISAALADLLGSVPVIIESWSLLDTGMWDGTTGQVFSFWGVNRPSNPFVWTNPGSFFVKITLPTGSPYTNEQLAELATSIVARLKVCGITAFMQVISGTEIGGPFSWDVTSQHWDSTLTWDAH
jgi:hypothetical protein